MSRSRFTRRQRLVLALMAMAVVLVFGLLAVSVVSTLRPSPLTSGSTLPPPTASNPPPSATALTATVPLTTVLATSTVPTPTATLPVSLSPIQSARAVHEVGRIVAGVRDLPPVEQIPVTFPTEHEVAVSLLQRYQGEQPQEMLGLYVALGLIPPLDPLPMPDVAAQAARISSAYLTDERQILLVAGRGSASVEDERALAHAWVHALQDHRFDLDSLTPCQPTTDARLGLRALVEGDAVLTTALYAGLESDPDQVDRLAQMAVDAEQPVYAPLMEDPAFERLRLFPYREGGRIVAALQAEGGWQAVNRAYTHPPCSAEQVLHPERYAADEPVQRAALPDLGPALGAGWGLVRRDTLGEFLIGLHLAVYLDDDAVAWDAADGWAGDTFTLWKSEEGEELIAWRLAWDDRDEAEAFQRAYALLVPRFRVPPLIAFEAPLDLPGRLWEGIGGAAYLARAGRVVTVVWGPDVETVTAAVQALP